MKLSELKTGMRIVTRNKEEYIVLKNVKNPYKETEDMYILLNKIGWLSESNYNEDMTTRSGNKDFDIMEVYAQNSGIYIDANVIRDKIEELNLIWKRKDIKKMTVSEICKKLGYEVEIVKE